MAWFGGEPAIPVAIAPDSFGAPRPGGRPSPDMMAGLVRCRSSARVSSQIRTCKNGTNVIMFDWLHFYVDFFKFLSVWGLGLWGFVYFIFVLLLDFSLLSLIIVVGGRSCHRGEWQAWG